MEGVMMKNQEKYAVAVRKPDHEIEVKVSEYTGIIKNKKIRNMPILRGVFSFIESLVLGMQTLTYSASFFEDEEVDEKKKEPMTEEERRRQEQKEKKQENAMMGGTVVLSIVLAVAVFMMLPYYLSTLFQKVITSQWVIALLEGVIRLVIFIGYVALISLMKDIRQVHIPSADHQEDHLPYAYNKIYGLSYSPFPKAAMHLFSHLQYATAPALFLHGQQLPDMSFLSHALLLHFPADFFHIRFPVKNGLHRGNSNLDHLIIRFFCCQTLQP